MLKNTRGQNILEYVIIVVVVVGALLAINIYMKRGVEGKLRESTDEIGQQFDIEKTQTAITRTREAGISVQTVKGGKTTSKTPDTGEVRTESGTETVSGW